MEVETAPISTVNAVGMHESFRPNVGRLCPSAVYSSEELLLLPLGGAFSLWGGKWGLPGGDIARERVMMSNVIESLVTRRGEEKEEEASDDDDESAGSCMEHEGSNCLRRCSWITESSDEAYVSFHDECWGMPTYDDNRLFELLTLSGMLIDRNWTEILKRRDLFRRAFRNFDYAVIAAMHEADIAAICCCRELNLADYRVRSIINNAKCIQKVTEELGSFSNYIWGQVKHRPMVSCYRHKSEVPTKSPKSQAISRDLVRRGFRLVGPVIVHSFMQAAGMFIDHLVDCFRFYDCVRLAERSRLNNVTL